MNRLYLIAFIILSFVSCRQEQHDGRFSISGEIKNAENQKIFLEQLYFSQKDPEVLDTTQLKNGKFTLSAIAAEEGMFRIRLEKSGTGFIFINDAPSVTFKADLKDMSLAGPQFNTHANALLKNFITGLQAKRTPLTLVGEKLDNLKKNNGSDSAIAAEMTKRTELNAAFDHFIIQYIDSSSDPVLTMFALGYTGSIDPAALKNIVPNLVKRFPKQQAIASVVSQYKQLIAEQEHAVSGSKLKPGTIAPEIIMNDVNNKPFTLSQLRGKYVLVDFWASWCAPCRELNPQLLSVYNTFKDRNFSIVSVSLDDKKNEWLDAIKADNLPWIQVSDLKKWNGSVVNAYGFDEIPFNVLLDTSGLIIATKLDGHSLEAKLAERLK